MIKKIVCPTDFSKASINATEYAAKLAQVFAAELLFINVQKIMPVAAIIGADESADAALRKNFSTATERLKELSFEANKMFNISADFEVDVSSKSLAKIFSELEAANTMIVMGTNGVDDMNEYFFSTNTYHVIKETKCPVLVVPENAAYSSFKTIVFAWDYSSKSKFSFAGLHDFKKAFNPNFIFLHVSKHSDDLSHDVFRALRNEIETVLGEDEKIEYKQLFSYDIPESIDEYMIKSNANMLSITFYNRGLIRDIFHGTVARELTETAQYPILVLHAEKEQPNEDQNLIFINSEKER